MEIATDHKCVTFALGSYPADDQAED
jgi:hypothetical protein